MLAWSRSCAAVERKRTLLHRNLRQEGRDA
jgi:hypothetical protein